jgi:hypothetical protein
VSDPSLQVPARQRQEKEAIVPITEIIVICAIAPFALFAGVLALVLRAF